MNTADERDALWILLHQREQAEEQAKQRKQQFGNLIQGLLKRLDVNQSAFAAAIGVSQPSVSFMEGGRVEPKKSTVESIIKWLDDGHPEKPKKSPRNRAKIS